MPVLGFNCSRYNLNLIKEHPAELLADVMVKVKVGKNANKMMFMNANSFRFLDIFNYLSRGTRNEK